MKKIAAYVFLFASLNVSAQNDTAEDTTAKPAITAIGKPDGAKAEMKIGKDGGSFTSSDGKVKLIVPEGAISKKTTFSIQPTTNLAPNGKGKAYQMEPSGTNFQKPLQVIFYYTDAETKDHPLELSNIAVQDEKGQWSSTKATKDSIAKTLITETWHFSTFVSYLSAEIHPSSARIKINGSLRLKIIGVFNYEEGLMTVNGQPAPLVVKTESAEIWKVNGIPKGNGTVGLISASQDYTAIFQAPAKVPTQNPVAVTVQENFYNYAPGKRWDVYTLVSNITIYEDAYEVKMISRMKGPAGSVLGDMTYVDDGSFIVSLEDQNPRITEIKNNDEKLSYKGSCKTELMNPGKNTGMIHISGTPIIKITPPQPPGQEFSIVEITFVQPMAVMSLLRITCPKSPPVSLPAMGTPALPYKIKFTAKEGEQVIQEVGDQKGEEVVYYKFTVKQIKDE